MISSVKTYVLIFIKLLQCGYNSINSSLNNVFIDSLVVKCIHYQILFLEALLALAEIFIAHIYNQHFV